MIQIYLKKMIDNVVKILNTFFLLTEKQCPILRKEGHQFTPDYRDKVEVAGKHYSSSQRNIFV